MLLPCALTVIDAPTYWRKLKQRLKAEGNETVTDCHGLKMQASDGKMRLTDVANTEQLLRLVQSIPSPKAEPFKQWLARVGYLQARLLADARSHLTPIDSFLRKNSLDALPQLWSIVVDDMSFVGPRPALFNQYDLIALRSQHGVYQLVPGPTGWAQVNGRDELPIPDKVKLDAEYLHKQSLRI